MVPQGSAAQVQWFKTEQVLMLLKLAAIPWQSHKITIAQNSNPHCKHNNPTKGKWLECLTMRSTAVQNSLMLEASKEQAELTT